MLRMAAGKDLEFETMRKFTSEAATPAATKASRKHHERKTQQCHANVSGRHLYAHVVEQDVARNAVLIKMTETTKIIETLARL